MPRVDKGCVTCGGVRQNLAASRRLSEEEEQALMAENTLAPLDLASSVSLPKVIILPARYSIAFGDNRRLTINARDQLVRPIVRDWMIHEPRYMSLFRRDVDETLTDESASIPSPTANSEVESDEVKGEEQNPKVLETTPHDENAWNAHWVMPKLREYAAAHSIELSSEDRKKDDVIAKLRAAGLPEAQAS